MRNLFLPWRQMYILDNSNHSTIPQLMKLSIHFLFIVFSLNVLFSCTEINQDQTTFESKQVTEAKIDFDKKLKDLGIQLEAPSKPVANYVNVVQAGKLLFLAGKGPKMPDGKYVKGTLGKDLSEKEGYQSARRVAELQLAVLKDHLGDLNKVKRIVKVMALVRSTDDFGNQPEVVNGFSDLMVEVFGEKGKHARAALGTNALPREICVEIEMIVEIY